MGGSTVKESRGMLVQQIFNLKLPQVSSKAIFKSLLSVLYQEHF